MWQFQLIVRCMNETEGAWGAAPKYSTPFLASPRYQKSVKRGIYSCVSISGSDFVLLPLMICLNKRARINVVCKAIIILWKGGIRLNVNALQTAG